MRCVFVLLPQLSGILYTVLDLQTTLTFPALQFDIIGVAIFILDGIIRQ